MKESGIYDYLNYVREMSEHLTVLFKGEDIHDDEIYLDSVDNNTFWICLRNNEGVSG